ncbi:hypothetical protein [Saccharopolyspora sp. NPDC002376]
MREDRVVEEPGFHRAVRGHICRSGELVAVTSEVVGGVLFADEPPAHHIHWLVVSDQERHLNPVVPSVPGSDNVPVRSRGGRDARVGVVMTAQHYLGVSGLARQLGVTRQDVSKWLSRYPAASEHPFPEPDVEVDGAPGWTLERVPEVELWRSSIPGQYGG